MSPPNGVRYRIGEVEVDPAQACVRRAGEEVHLRAKSFQILLYLLRNRSRLVTREELFAHAWPGVAVTEDALTQSIVELRRVLGDDPRNPRYLKTVPKAGFRFVGEVEEVDGETLMEVEETTAVQVQVHEEFAPSPARIWLAWAVAAAALAACGLAVLRGPRFAVDPTLPALGGRTPVAVMFFENRSGQPELDWLREGLPDMLITNLSRSPRLALLSREQVRVSLNRVGRDPRTAIGLAEAVQAAARSKAKLVVLGALSAMGEAIRLDVQIYDTDGGRLLAGDSLTADRPASLLAGLDSLSLKLASQIGAPLAGGGRRAFWSEARTSSLEAFRAYTMGVDLADRLHSAEAIAMFRKALDADRNFAMAEARIGYAYSVAWGQPENGKPYLERAFRSQQALTVRDRAYIAAWYALANEDYDAAIRAYRQIVADYPAETDPYRRLGRLLRGERRLPEARDALLRGLAIDPDAADLHVELGIVYSDMAQFEAAIASTRRAAEIEPGEPNMHDSLGLMYHRAGRYGEAVESYRQALRLNPNFELAVIHLGNTYLQQGRYREALAQYEGYREMAPSVAERRRAAEAMAILYRRWGKPREALAEILKGWAPPNQHPLAWILAAEMGSTPASEALRNVERWLKAYVTPSNRGARLSSRWGKYYTGSLMLLAGRREEALHRLRNAIGEPTPYWAPDPMEDCLAGAALEAGRLDEAIGEYERILRLNAADGLARYHLALALERKGAITRARSEMARFLEVWRDAGADIPEIVDARRRLTSGTTS